MARSNRIEIDPLDIVHRENKDMAYGGKLRNGKSTIEVMLHICNKNLKKGESRLQLNSRLYF